MAFGRKRFLKKVSCVVTFFYTLFCLQVGPAVQVFAADPSITLHADPRGGWWDAISIRAASVLNDVLALAGEPAAQAVPAAASSAEATAPEPTRLTERWEQAKKAMRRVVERHTAPGPVLPAEVTDLAGRLQRAKDLLETIEEGTKHDRGISSEARELAQLASDLQAQEAVVVAHCTRIRAALAAAGFHGRLARVDDFVKRFKENAGALRAAADGIQRKARAGKRADKEISAARDLLRPEEALKERLAPRGQKASDPAATLRTREPQPLAAAQEASAQVAPLEPAAGGVPLASSPPASEDLAETPEVQMTPEIQALAASLEYSPVRIYEHVRNNFEFEPYFGSMKGSQATLETSKGNDYDLASLLLALLRAAGVPSRYERGTVDIPADRVKDWLGITDADAANSILNTAGIAAIPFVDENNVIVFYRIDRLWVRAFVPFGNYRGVPNTADGGAWVPLDPAFKTHSFQPGIMGIPGNVPFDEAAYLSQVRPELAFEFYREQVRDYLLVNMPGATIPDIPYTGPVIPEEFGILPASLPYKLVGSGGEAAELPDSLRHQIIVTIDDGFSFLLQSTLRLPEVLLSRRTVSWVPATPADQAIVDFYGGLANTPPFVVDVKPRLKLDGSVHAEGLPVLLGSTVRLCIDFVAPESGVVDTRCHTIVAGEYAAIGLDGHHISNRLLFERAGKLIDANALVGTPGEDQDDLEGELLNIAGILYFLRDAEGITALTDIFRFQAVHDVAEGLTTANLNVLYLFDRPFAVTPGNQTLDVQRSLAPGLFSLDGDDTNTPALRRLTGVNGSAQEHAMWEELIAIESISAIKALQLANERGIPVHVIDSANQGNIISCHVGGAGTVYQCMAAPGCTAPSGAISAIQAEVASGKTVTVPECLITLNDWSGTGYISEDPVTRAAAYIIYGGLATVQEVGSATTVPPAPDPFVPVDPQEGENITAGLPAERVDASNVNDTLARLVLPSALKNRIRQLVGTGFTVYASQVVLDLDGREVLVFRVEDSEGGVPRFFSFDLLAGGAGTDEDPQQGPDCNQSNTCTENKGECRDPCACTGGLVAVISGNTFERFDDISIRNAGLPIRLQRSSSSVATGQCGVNGRCRGGANNNETCMADANCPAPFFGACQKGCFDDADCGRCTGGANNNEACGQDADCPDPQPGACQTDVCTTGPFGFGWTHSYNMSLVEHANGFVTLFNEDGGQFLFTSNPDGSYNAPLGLYWTLTKVPGGLTLRKKDGTTLSFGTGGALERIQDRNGNEQSLAYNPDGTLATITDPVRGVALMFGYNPQGKIETVTDLAGRTWSYAYEPANPKRLASVTTPSDPDTPAATTSYAYFDTGFIRHNLRSITDPRGNTRSFRYYTNDKVFQESDEVGATTSFSYNPSKREAHVINARGFERVYSYDDTGRVTKIQFPDGTDTRFTWDSDGNRTSVTDQAGNTTGFEYDARGNLTKSIDALLHATSFTYGNCRGGSNQNEPCNLEGECPDSFAGACVPEPFNQVTSITDPKANPPTRIEYDASGNPITITDAAGTATEMAYDEPGRNASTAHGLVTRVTRAKSLPEESTTTFEHDTAGYVSRVTDPRGVLTPDPNDFVTSLVYDTRGNVLTSTDALGRATDFAYDLRDRLVQVTDAAQPVRGATQYTYDANGNLTKVIDARNNSTTFEYDGRNQLVKTTDPLGQPPSDPAGHFDTYEYDANANLAAKTDRNGQHIEYEYNTVDRLIGKMLPGGLLTTFGYDRVGNLVSVVDPDSALTMTYDAGHRLASTSTAASPSQPSVLISYTYDENGNRVTMSDPTGTQTYTYDALNHPLSITNPSGQTVAFDYDFLSRRTQNTFPNGTTTTFVYDAASQLLSIVHKIGATPISSFAYTYDGVGNRTTLTQQRTAITVEPLLAYDYDTLNRLIAATHPLPGQPQETFTYDAVGNRLRRDGQTMDAVFDAANRLLEDQDFCYAYDPNGNQIQKTAKVAGICSGDLTRYTYDAENRLIRIDLPAGSVAEYRYDGLGGRIEENVDQQIAHYVYDNEDILSEFDATGGLVARYTHGAGIDAPLLTQLGFDGVAEPFSYQMDGLGSITGIADGTGLTVQSYAYAAFGMVTNDIGSIHNSYNFTAREHDSLSNLYYYRARYYDPATGRFLSTDPVFTTPFYQYADGNPVNSVDPSGELPIIVGIVLVGAVVGAVTEAATSQDPLGRALLRGALKGGSAALVGTVTTIVTGGNAWVGGAGAGATSNFVGQAFDIATSNKSWADFSLQSLGRDVGVGALTAGVMSGIPVFQQQGFRIGNVRGVVTPASELGGFFRNRPITDLLLPNVQRVLAAKALGGVFKFGLSELLDPCSQ